MLVPIKRTSVGSEKPCEEAVLKKFVSVDIRTVSTLAEARQARWGGQFFASGSNHREENGMVVRDLDLESTWCIDINSLEDVLKLFIKYGELIITTSHYKGTLFELEIYDDYRE